MTPPIHVGLAQHHKTGRGRGLSHKEAESEKEKSDLSTDQYFGRISLLKNPIDTRPDGLEP